MGGVFLWELGCAGAVQTFPPPSPGWPGYDLNDDAKMYMSKRWFLRFGILGLGLSLWETKLLGHIGGAFELN